MERFTEMVCKDEVTRRGGAGRILEREGPRATRPRWLQTRCDVANVRETRDLLAWVHIPTASLHPRRANGGGPRWAPLRPTTKAPARRRPGRHCDCGRDRAGRPLPGVSRERSTRLPHPGPTTVPSAESSGLTSDFDHPGIETWSDQTRTGATPHPSVRERRDRIRWSGPPGFQAARGPSQPPLIRRIQQSPFATGRLPAPCPCRSIGRMPSHRQNPHRRTGRVRRNGSSGATGCRPLRRAPIQIQIWKRIPVAR